MKPLYARFALLLCSILPFYFSFAQTDCGFDEQHKRLLVSDPAYKISLEGLTQRLRRMNYQRSLSPNAPLATIYRIPVVVHVIHNGESIGVGTNISDAQIQSAITSMSQFYRSTLGSSPDTEIEFELANLDPACQATTGINRVAGTGVASYSTDGLVLGGSGNEIAIKNLSRWSNRDYYNIWIVSEINNNNGGGGIQGFAYFPLTPSSIDGAVILFNAFGYDPTNTLGYNLKTATDENKTAIHELGHAFGLYHSFQGDDFDNDGVADQCPVNTNCTVNGDEVCDTDPHRRSLSNCPTGANVCGGMIDNIAKNFMDYSSAACQDRFTIGQITRMRDVIAFYRPGLVSSIGLNTSTPPPFNSPTAAFCTRNTNAMGLSGDYAGVMNININGRDFNSLEPRWDNPGSGYLNSIDCRSLTQFVRGNMYTFNATVLAANQEQLRAWIDYNNDGNFDNTTEQIHFNSSIPNAGNVTTSSDFIVPVTATVNTTLRMRVIDDLTPIYASATAIADACHIPHYGQVEDYPVMISAVLPITLESFSGKRNGDHVVLTWVTSLERHAKEYVIEKSSDGVNFIKIGTLPIVLNNYASRQYSFVDRSVIHENNYYRLRLVDLDGQFEFSKIVFINFSHTTKALFSLLNNPVQNNLEIQFSDVTKGKVQLRLTDITGKTIVTWSGENLANRRIRMNISDNNLSKGIYVLHARIQGRNYTEKVIIK